MVHPHPAALLARPDRVTRTLVRSEWLDLEATYAERSAAALADHATRAARGEAHPVEDFLFTYYRLRPGQLRRWHPGAGVALADAAGTPRAGWAFYRTDGDSVSVDTASLVERRRDRIADTLRVLTATAARPPSFGCFGLHEWAMHYRQDRTQYRHAGWPLRLSADVVDRTVEERRLACTHFDAFRFFSPAAAPRNALTLTRAGQDRHEQPGCLHAGMDLYRYAYRLTPLLPSDLVLDCFELARSIRQVDMRATPYDFARLGLSPIAVETPAGRAEYVAHQQRFARAAAPLRQRIVEACRALSSPRSDTDG